MSAKLTFAAILAGLFAIAIYFTTYVVNEGKQAVITQFGKPVSFVTEPGLNFRIPLIQSVHRLEKRLLPWDGACLLYTSPSPRDQRGSRMPSSA